MSYASMLHMAEVAKAAAEAQYRRTKKDTEYPERGEAVEVVRGRKIPVGTKGKLISTGESQYGHWVRFTTEAGEDVLTNAGNVVFPHIAARREEAWKAEEKATADYRAVLAEAVKFVNIDLANPVERGRTQQHAYSDTTESTYACNPEATDEEVKAVVAAMDPRGSSWGALRWSGGSSVSSRPAPDRVVVFSSVSLCD